METNIRRVEDIAIVTPLADRLDMSNAKELVRKVEPLIEVTSRMIVVLDQVAFTDSSGIGAIVKMLKQVCARGGDMKLCGLSRPVQVIFELVRIHRVVEIYETTEEAVAAFGPLHQAEQYAA